MRGVIVYGVLLVLAMVASYFTWTAEELEGSDEGKVAVYQAAKGDLSKLHWVTSKVDVTVEQKSDAKGDYPWVVVTETKEIRKRKKDKNKAKNKNKAKADDAEGKSAKGKGAKGKGKNKAKGKGKGKDAKAKGKKADPHGHDDGHGHGHGDNVEVEEDDGPVETETKTTGFRGNEAADELWTQFSPLMALRELKVQNEDPSEFGYDGDKAGTLTVSRRSGEVAIKVGGETYGSKDRYMESGGRTFLLEKGTLRSLEFAKTRLVERKLHPLAEKDILSVTVTDTSGNGVTFDQNNKDDRAQAYWSRQGSTDEDGTAGTWLGKAFRMKVQSYPTEDEAGTLSPIFTWTVTGADGTWKIDMLQGEGDNPDFYARTEWNRALVELTKSTASDTVADISAIFDAPPE